ncbi:hypothetical protein [uncultured phage cr106_1]|uniref:Uncharacterized protein n=1 Tax=uncultured phage cr106_1 TaxID=2772062 RepID=A0A7M1RV58_9CAUD|nr:hypothetical protein KNV29_gp094 [uncultured phage cr106_1]QOR58293.1 hypothetical protein [uncultured phage cr106_1]
MVRTIYVVFVKSKLSNTFGLKRYMFLCSFDIIKEGDIIKDPRYSSLMQVVAIDNCSSRTQKGFTLVDIQIETLNGKPLLYNDFYINQQRNELKEKRNITISLKEAREWYKGDNSTLREIALKAYSEEELIGYYNIARIVATGYFGAPTPKNYIDKLGVLNKLATLAEYYNNGWKMEAGKTGYFLSQALLSTSGEKVIYIDYEVSIVHAGVVYFKNVEDIRKAVDILKDELDNLF